MLPASIVLCYPVWRKKILFHQFHNWKVLENALDLIRMKHLLNSPLPGCHLLLL